jgi:hypothetical protein
MVPSRLWFGHMLRAVPCDMQMCRSAPALLDPADPQGGVEGHLPLQQQQHAGPQYPVGNLKWNLAA